MLRNELLTLFRRRRNHALLAVLASVPVIVVLALALSDSSPQAGEGPPFIDQVTHNGFFAALTGLTLAIGFLLPLTVAVISGDTIAGEANLGTLRYLLIRPISRTDLLVVKFTAAVIFTFVAAITVVGAGLIAGGVTFGFKNVITLSGVQLSLAEGFLRMLLAALVVAASMSGLIAVGLFISTLTEQPLGATATVFVIWVLSSILDSIPQVRSIHPALFTHYWLNFTDIFRVPVSLHAIGKGLLLQLGWIAVFASAAWARFTSKDVLA